MWIHVLLLPVARPSANKMGMDADSNNRGCFAMQGDKPCLSFYGLMVMVTTNMSAIWLTGYEM